MNPLLFEYLKHEIWRAQLHSDNLIIYSESHSEIMQMDESMSGYEDIRNQILTTMWNSKGDEGWEQFDRYDAEVRRIPDRDVEYQLARDKHFRQGTK